MNISPRCHVEPDIFFNGPKQAQKFNLCSNEYINKIPCSTGYFFNGTDQKRDKSSLYQNTGSQKFSYHADQMMDTTIQIAGPPPWQELTPQNDANYI